MKGEDKWTSRSIGAVEDRHDESCAHANDVNLAVDTVLDHAQSSL